MTNNIKNPTQIRLILSQEMLDQLDVIAEQREVARLVLIREFLKEAIKNTSVAVTTDSVSN